MPTKKQLPYLPIDSLSPGDEVRIKMVGLLPVIGILEGFHRDSDGTFWLKLAVPNGLLWVLVADIQWRDGLPMVQRLQTVVDAEHWDSRVFDSIMLDGRVV